MGIPLIALAVMLSIAWNRFGAIEVFSKTKTLKAF
jgi:hypothetical protein